MTLVEGDDMQRLWALVVDLSSQLNMNRQQITSLQTQLQNLKAHTVHTNTGFALRRFNVDVAKETFESELERLNVHLAQENNDLRWENKMNERLIKEYEQCLDLVMKKFRAFSHATQTHTLKLTQYYEDLLASNTHDVAAVSLHAQASLSSTLSNLGTLVRNALREVEGEAPSPPPSMLFHDDGAGEDEAVPGEGSSASASSSSRKRQQSQQAHLWPGSGGYTGKAGDAAAQRSDAALEREAELQMLRYENETLKEILDMAEGKGLDVGAGKDKLSLGTPRGGGSGGSASGHGGGGAGAQRKVRTPSMHQQPLPQQQQQQQQQLPGIGINQLYPPPPAAGQQQQQQQPAYSPMAPRSTPQDIPAAPFPSSSISAPLSHPVPPPTPPSTSGGGGGAGGAGRIPLHERMQQAADAIRSQGQQQQQQQTQQHAVTLHASSADEPSATSPAPTAPSGSSAAPYLIPERASSTTATSQPSIPALSSSSSFPHTSSSDVQEAASAAAAPSAGDAAPPPSLVPTPSESGSAQSDIRGASVLPLTESNTTTPAMVAGPGSEESEELQKEAEVEAEQDLPAVEPEVEAIKQHREAGEAGEVERAAVAAPLDVEKEAPGEVESEPPAEHDVDLNDDETKPEMAAAAHEATVEDDTDAQPEEQAGTSEVVPAVLPSSEASGSASSASEGEAAGGLEEAAITAAMEPAAAAETTSASEAGEAGTEEAQTS